jgi:hypothetical protein
MKVNKILLYGGLTPQRSVSSLWAEVRNIIVTGELKGKAL